MSNTITLNDDQAEEVKAMLKASIIRMTEWITEAKGKCNEKEAAHLEEMKNKRKELQKHILSELPSKKK